MKRAALVTGAGAGIGQATALRLARDGLRVAVLDIDAGAAEGVATEIEAAGGTAIPVTVDVSNGEQVASAVAHVMEAWGPVTVLVNNAGIVKPALLSDVELSDWDRTVTVNLKGPMLCAQAVVEGMKSAGWGRIVNVSSRAALGKVGRTCYSASKAGIIGITRTWALELGRFGITVNAVAPGPIETTMYASNNQAYRSERDHLLRGIPVGRMGKPEEVAGLIAYLASPEAGFITGQVIFICGGTSIASSADW